MVIKSSQSAPRPSAPQPPGQSVFLRAGAARCGSALHLLPSLSSCLELSEAPFHGLSLSLQVLQVLLQLGDALLTAGEARAEGEAGTADPGAALTPWRVTVLATAGPLSTHTSHLPYFDGDAKWV